MELEKIIQYVKENKNYFILGTIIVLGLLFGQAEASYKFPYSERESITMDVDKVNGGGGTWRCPSVQACYIKVLEAEARGATHYCNSIVIKRDGRVVWWRNYR